MNKKVTKKAVKKKTNDDKESLNVKEIASSNHKKVSYLSYSLIIIFIIMLCYMCVTLVANYIKKNQPATKIVEVNNKNRVIILNSGEIKESINNKSFASNENEIIVERINSIELISGENATDKARIEYDVKYEINKNTFNRNLYNTSNSQLLVRFSYSLDKENWTYVKNVISTSDSTISPLVGNYYDIAGLETRLKIKTNVRLEASKNGSNKVYWRSETIFKNVDNIDGILDASFVIDYKDWN